MKLVKLVSCPKVLEAQKIECTLCAHAMRCCKVHFFQTSDYKKNVNLK